MFALPISGQRWIRTCYVGCLREFPQPSLLATGLTNQAKHAFNIITEIGKTTEAVCFTMEMDLITNEHRNLSCLRRHNIKTNKPNAIDPRMDRAAAPLALGQNKRNQQFTRPWIAEATAQLQISIIEPLAIEARQFLIDRIISLFQVTEE